MKKAIGGNGIPAELFQILKMMLFKCCTQYASNNGQLSRGHRTRKGVLIPIPKKGNAKECSNFHTIALISHDSKVMLNFQMLKLVLEKAKEPEIKLPTSTGSSKKQESSKKKKKSISALLTMPKPLTVWITTNCGKF